MNTCLNRGLTRINGLHRFRNNDWCSLQPICRKANGRVLDGRGNPAPTIGAQLMGPYTLRPAFTHHVSRAIISFADCFDEIGG